MNRSTAAARSLFLAGFLSALLAAWLAGSPSTEPAAETGEGWKYRLDPEWMARLRTASDSADWPQWRGPNRDGVSGSKLAETPWPSDGPPRRWKVPGGPGHSGIAVAGDRLYTMLQEGEEEIVLCLDAATGATRWRFSARAKFVEPSGGPGPRATPAVFDGCVYTLGGTGLLHALDGATGAILWRRDLVRDFGGRIPEYGFASSPLIEGDLVIVQPGAPEASVAAFDRKDGRRVWATGKDPAGYSSPVAATIAGRRQIVALTGAAVVGIDARHGRILWSHPWTASHNIVTPVVDGDRVFVSSGYGKGCTLLRIAADPWTVTPVYVSTKMKSQLSTPVLDRGSLYGFDDEFLVCLAFETGELRWKARGFGKGGLVAADDRLIVLGETGRLALVDATPAEFRERAAIRISETRCWAAPSVARGRLWLRDQESFSCFDIEASRSEPGPARVPWLASAVKGSPDPPLPYRTTPAFPRLRFDTPVDLVAVPGTEFLAVAEHRGSIRLFVPRPEVETSELLVDLSTEVLGLAFHPEFSRTGVFYVLHATRPVGANRVSRFVARKDGRWSVDRASASVVIEYPAKGSMTHQGGGLRFGPDGFLYVGIGDGSPAMDADATGQDLRDLAGSILRLDVEARPYAAPSDNPFVSRKDARPEIWAYGFRQPWRMSFDAATRDLWVGDVGQEGWESVHRVRRGANAGWSVTEGGHPFRKDRPAGPTPIDPPVAVHSHAEFRAIIGGAVYRGPISDLAGSYVYGDHVTGSIWELRHDGGRVARHRELASTALSIVSFCGEDGKELYILDLRGSIHRLVPETRAAANPDFPRTLSATGLFESAANLRPAPGVIPYEVNASLWSDGTVKERLLALPGNSRIRFDGIRNDAVQPPTPAWEFPVGTVLVKTFFLGTEAGRPATRRRIETRLLARLESPSGESAWQGFSYQWKDDQSDAELVGPGGRDVLVGRQSWRFPGRRECGMCHTASASFVLGVTTAQMNRDVDVPGEGPVNQLKRLERLGLFDGPLPAAPAALPRLADWTDERQDLTLRARSYLHANCAHCHVPLGGGNSPFQVHAFLSLRQTATMDAPPVHGDYGLADARLIAPGSPERSILAHRMGLSGAGRMPPLASSVVDDQGVKLVRSWIGRMAPPDPAPSGPRPLWLLPAAAALLLGGGAGYLRWRRPSVR